MPLFLQCSGVLNLKFWGDEFFLKFIFYFMLFFLESSDFFEIFLNFLKSSEFFKKLRVLQKKAQKFHKKLQKAQNFSKS